MEMLGRTFGMTSLRAETPDALRAALKEPDAAPGPCFE